MDPSTQNLHLIPNPVDLKRICKAYAALEAILISDQTIRNSRHKKNCDNPTEENFSYFLGFNIYMEIVFGEQGTCIVGFNYDCDLVDRFEDAQKEILRKEEELERKKRKWWMFKKFEPKPVWDIFYTVDDLPEEIEKLLKEAEAIIDQTSFCVWQTQTDTKWQKGRISAPKIELDEDVVDLEDGSSFLLRYFDGDPITVKNNLSDFVDRDLDLETIEKVVNGEAITKEMAQELNPEHQDYEKLKSDLDEIGFPHQL
ncbi:hypothetical protein Murru_0723 [Allomuricauda ruestringensis DSM 13258]|uniref:Uncharacterized protein n=1 Tax=Allomuricauda ruestringensis (strain DSM 13258 / CIP 107369 / LMG 19739 / B1) TaxID=886377 RepID=G2PRX8_ALLRU|nr:hypothetical protein [Allomuricauda ruestringensis]AEM69773.1 hypothetical protein Murru_0723 [Allomuricauda ruestringensis DSM 13258]